MFPGNPGQLAQRLQLGKLGGIVGIGKRSRTQAVTQREADVVALHQRADPVEVLVEEVLLVVVQTPLP